MTRTMEVVVAEAEATTAIRSVCWLKSGGFWLVHSQVTGLQVPVCEWLGLFLPLF